MARIVVVGSINMDLVVRAARIPAPGETILGGAFDTFPGGKGANQAVCAARQGAAVAFVGRVGADAFGRQLVAGLQAEGVGIEKVGMDEAAATGVALIIVAGDGENSIVVVPGANGRLLPRHVEAAAAAFQGADVVLLQLEIPLETVRAAAGRARAAGACVVLNPAPAQALPPDLLAQVDVLVPNESETALLTGLPVSTLAQVEAAARSLLDYGTGDVVVTLGARGALLVGAERTAVHVPAFAVRTVDTTAAGDAFAGTLSVALAEAMPLPAAIRRACAAGALAATRLGAQPSLPMKADIDRLVAGEGR
jgi:ribokinase